MEKLYTEKQYSEYSKLMSKMANCDYILSGAVIHFEIEKWLEDNHITKKMETQMSEKLEQECENEMKLANK